MGLIVGSEGSSPGDGFRMSGVLLGGAEGWQEPREVRKAQGSLSGSPSRLSMSYNKQSIVV